LFVNPPTSWVTHWFSHPRLNQEIYDSIETIESTEVTIEATIWYKKHLNNKTQAPKRIKNHPLIFLYNYFDIFLTFKSSISIKTLFIIKIHQKLFYHLTYHFPFCLSLHLIHQNSHHFSKIRRTNDSYSFNSLLG